MADHAPLISVCMPVYNAERFVAEAVTSVLGQTRRDFELLILDDGSTDGSLAILKRHAEADPRIRLTSRPNRGLAATLNELVDQARGEFIARMDSDDISLPERFERQVRYLQAHPDCLVVGCQALVIDTDGDPLCVWFQGQTHEELDAQNLRVDRQASLCHPSVMMRRGAVLEVGKYSEQWLHGEDLDLWLRLAERGRLGNLPEVLIKYRLHGANYGTLINLRVDRASQDFREILAGARQRRGLPSVELPERPQVPEQTPGQSIHGKWGWQALMGGYVPTARKHARRYLRESPFSVDAWRLLYCALRGR